MVYMTTERNKELVQLIIDRTPGKTLVKKFGKPLIKIIKIAESMGSDCDYLKSELPVKGRRKFSDAVSEAKTRVILPERGANKGAPIAIDVDLIVSVKSVGVQFNFGQIKLLKSEKAVNQ